VSAPLGTPERSEVRFDRAVLEDIARAASTAYPFEGCGALLGERGHVRVTLPLPNTEKGSPHVKFEVSSRDYLRVEREADAQGLRLLGFWHSHPDHPARPSATDRARAWEGFLTVIVSVQEGQARDIGAWEIHGRELPFELVEIESPGFSSELVTTLWREGEK
jgi:proteasome lid subunit RPN8/RPN11